MSELSQYIITCPSREDLCELEEDFETLREEQSLCNDYEVLEFLFDFYYKTKLQQQLDRLKAIESPSQTSGALDAIGYDSSGNVIGTFTVPPQMAQQLSQRMSNVSVGYQIQIVEKEKGD